MTGSSARSTTLAALLLMVASMAIFLRCNDKAWRRPRTTSSTSLTGSVRGALRDTMIGALHTDKHDSWIGSPRMRPGSTSQKRTLFSGMPANTPFDSTDLFTTFLLQYMNSQMNSSAAKAAVTQAIPSNATVTTTAAVGMVLDIPRLALVPTKLAVARMDAGYLQLLLTPDFELHLQSLVGFHLTSNSGDLLGLHTATTPTDHNTTRYTMISKQSVVNQTMQMIVGGSILVSSCTASTNEYPSASYLSSNTTYGMLCLISSNLVPAKIVDAPRPIPSIAGVGSIKDAEMVSINSVLLPEWTTFNLFSYMTEFNARVFLRYSTFSTLWVASGLEALLRDSQHVTLLAPDNMGIDPRTRDFLLHPNNADVLRRVLSFHVLSTVFNFQGTTSDGQAEAEPLLSTSSRTQPVSVSLRTFGGQNITVEYSESRVLFNGVPAISFALTETSILYRIEKLIIPHIVADIVPVTDDSSSANEFANAAETFLPVVSTPDSENLKDGPFAEIPVRLATSLH
jgi:uncharacterized surface protein with fasciclin (FAS1) repeats